MLSNLDAHHGEWTPASFGEGIGRAASCRTIDDLALQPDSHDGVAISSLESGTTLLVRTRHSQYRLTVVDGANSDVLVEGGRLFPEAAPARLDGATAGGSALKMGWVGVGLRMEMSVDGVRIRTSPVRSIEIENA